nr:uncharacterized protein LOC129044752 [Pongo pygmaeus]
MCSERSCSNGAGLGSAWGVVAVWGFHVVRLMGLELGFSRLLSSGCTGFAHALTGDADTRDPGRRPGGAAMLTESPRPAPRFRDPRRGDGAGLPLGAVLGWGPPWPCGHRQEAQGLTQARGPGEGPDPPEVADQAGRHPGWGGCYPELSWLRRISRSPGPERCACTGAERGGQAAGWTHSPRAIGGLGLSDPAPSPRTR